MGGEQSKHSRIGDNYKSLDQVTKAVLDAGLESSNFIVGIDFTKSNENAGKKSFNGKCLHHISDVVNPYEHAISIIGRTLSSFDEDNLIPCFGFGDVTTHDEAVFSFYPDHRPCNGFDEVLSRYREIVPNVQLAGPSSFAPIIETAMEITDQSGGKYHILLVLVDGQVTRSADTKPGELSTQERSTFTAIVKASKYPLSIIFVGVGDGPWQIMKKMDDSIRGRAFDNIQFVNFTEIMSRNKPMAEKEAEFALAAVMEVPMQYKATIELKLLSKQVGGNSAKVPLPPPPTNLYPHLGGGFFPTFPTCPVCLRSKRNLALGCGHQTCHECGSDLNWCPVCHTRITNKIRLYDQDQLIKQPILKINVSRHGSISRLINSYHVCLCYCKIL